MPRWAGAFARRRTGPHPRRALARPGDRRARTRPAIGLRRDILASSSRSLNYHSRTLSSRTSRSPSSCQGVGEGRAPGVRLSTPHRADDPAHSPEIIGRRGAAIAARKQALSERDKANPGAVYDPEWFRRKILTARRRAGCPLPSPCRLRLRLRRSPALFSLGSPPFGSSSTAVARSAGIHRTFPTPSSVGNMAPRGSPQAGRRRPGAGTVATGRPLAELGPAESCSVI
jgi:hypothetical protein